MKKRRRLANKMTIIVCAVLCAVSAFFYIPMEAHAAVNTFSDTVSVTETTVERMMFNIRSTDNAMSFPAVTKLTAGKYYEIKYSGKLGLKLNKSFNVNTQNLYMHFGGLSFSLFERETSLGFDANVRKEYTFSGSFVYKAVSNPKFDYNFVMTISKNSSTTYDVTATHDFTFNIDSITEVNTSSAQDYQNGYTAGYSAGESAGYGNGYSNGFADGEASVDTDAIYDEAFQAGKNSVDTDSYYDAGYQAGYDAAYFAGYESGYDVGYQSAMDRIEKWGADTTDYPLRISSGSTNGYFSVHVGSDIPFNYSDSESWHNSNDYNPNHTYKYVINFSNFDVGLNSDILYDYWHLYLNIGGIEYNLARFNDTSVSVFIPGDRMSTSYSFDWVLYNCANFVSGDSNLAYLYVDYDFVIYDMGPSGDTQNHIANQTDQLTNGFDESQGNSVNSDLSTGLNEYQTAEDSLWATATTGLKDFTFFDFESVPAMITGMSFITSIMGSWFSYAGGASGVGIVLSILFSVMLVAMVLGLYRLYQSKGGKK